MKISIARMIANLTPTLILMGIPPPVAVGSGTASRGGADGSRPQRRSMPTVSRARVTHIPIIGGSSRIHGVLATLWTPTRSGPLWLRCPTHGAGS